jgi:methylglutaconyl-CoA hydratase
MANSNHEQTQTKEKRANESVQALRAEQLSAEDSVVLYAVENSVARITLNRPEKRNALNDRLVAELKESLLRADADEGVRVCVVTGAGMDFCSGADLAALQKISESSIVENLADAEILGELFTLIRRVKVPVVAAVRGRALAGGCGLAMGCDIVLASESARFGYPETKIGFVPAMVAAIVRRNVSEKRAFELLTLGGEIGAAEAVSLGLVNKVFADESFAPEVESYVAGFARVSRSAVMLTKRLLYGIDAMSFDESIASGADTNAIARMTPDCQNGIARFLKK